MASTPGYKNPPSLMHCPICDRAGRDGERQGDTCGDPLPIQFKPLTDAERVEDLQRVINDLPPIHQPIARQRCLGILVYPWLSDPF